MQYSLKFSQRFKSVKTNLSASLFFQKTSCVTGFAFLLTRSIHCFKKMHFLFFAFEPLCSPKRLFVRQGIFQGMSGGVHWATLAFLFELSIWQEAAELRSPELRFSSRSSIGMLPRPLSTFLSPSAVDALWRQAGWRQSCRAVFGGVVRSSSSVAAAACVFVSKASCVLEESRADDGPRISTYTAALASFCGFVRWFFSFCLFVWSSARSLFCRPSISFISLVERSLLVWCP